MGRWQHDACNMEPDGLFYVTPRAVLDSSTLAGTDARSRMLRQWYLMVQRYARLQRSNPYNELTAIAGIAQRAQQLVGGRYIFGLWETDMLRGLLWRRGRLAGDPLPPPSLQVVKGFVSPSWSWASVESPIFSQYTTGRDERRRLNQDNTRIEFHSFGTSINHFDPIRAGIPLETFRLRLRGVLKPVECIPGPVQRQDRVQYIACWGVTDSRMKLKAKIDMGIHGSHDQSGGHEVGVALPDTTVEPHTQCWCTRLTSEEGLLLKRLETGDFSRLGVFRVMGLDWFDRGEAGIITLI